VFIRTAVYFETDTSFMDPFFMIIAWMNLIFFFTKFVFT